MKGATKTTEADVGIRCFANDLEGFDGELKAKCSDFHVHEIDKNNKVVVLDSLREAMEPNLPKGFEKWYVSKAKTFTYKQDSEEQTAKIFYQYTDLNIKTKGKEVELEKVYKKRVRVPYTKFIIAKENVSDQEVLSQLAQKLKVNKSDIGFAGTKDKRAVTTQYMSVKGLSVHEVQQHTRSFKQFLIGRSARTMGPISLGDLSGNRFTIVVRNISLTGDVKTEIQNRVDAIQKSGFINYYGMQRFGTGAIPTHEYGKLILKKQWSQILTLLLTPHPGEAPGIIEAKKIWLEKKDAAAAANRLPPSAAPEIAVLRAISRLPPGTLEKDPRQVFQAVERRLRMMYVHAYQSYLWNHSVSDRWEKSGAKVVPGDRVMGPKGKPIDVTRKDYREFKLEDVVMPLPCAISCPDCLRPVMEREGITAQMFKDLASEYGTKGDWRNIIAKPTDVKFQVIKHTNKDDILVASDIDKIEGRIINTDNEGPITSVVIEFSLPSGVYATMCMREILKRTTEFFKDIQVTPEEQI